MEPVRESSAVDLSGAVRPSFDRGASVLVSGGTARQRAALLDAVVTSLGETPGGPLVVRLAASSRAELVPSLVDAVESALVRARAPGALYDDRGGALVRCLGGWLFRARAAGHTGLCVVLDALDAGVEQRGSDGGDETSTALRQLLRESASRPVSVLASSRAGTAAGAPALPRALVESFERVVTLGGPLTVTRDPSTLLAALGGRAFSLPALQDSLAGWLDLPRAESLDDTLIVFRAPLATPELDAPAEPLGWARRATVPPAADATTPDRETARDALLRGTDAIQSALALQRHLATLRRATPRDEVSATALFRATTRHLPTLRDRVRVGAEAVGAATPQLMAATDTALLDFDFMWQGLRGPAAQWETSLRARWQRHVESVEARGAAWVVLSGLRLDLWERLQSRVISALPGWSLADEGVHRATGDLAGVLEETVDEALRPRREVMQGVEVWRVTAYGRSLADRTVTLDEAAARVERALPSSLRAVAGGFAGATAVMVMSDVGEARGDASAFADIVPWALYTVAGGGR